MGATIPGSELDPSDPPPGSHPRLVSPAVLYMVSDEAPNGRIIQASNGRFASDMVFSNRGVDLGLNATYEDVLVHAEEILSTENATLKTNFWRDED